VVDRRHYSYESSWKKPSKINLEKKIKNKKSFEANPKI
jgi:hypothetical protein